MAGGSTSCAFGLESIPFHNRPIRTDRAYRSFYTGINNRLPFIPALSALPPDLSLIHISAVRSIDTVRPSDNALSLRRFLCGNRQPVARRFLGIDRQLVSAYGERNARIIGRKLISLKDIFAVRQRNGIFRAVPFKLDFLCAPRRFGKEARQLGMLLHTCRH